MEELIVKKKGTGPFGSVIDLCQRGKDEPSLEIGRAKAYKPKNNKKH